jgi:hypothetical protein
MSTSDHWHAAVLLVSSQILIFWLFGHPGRKPRSGE